MDEFIRNNWAQLQPYIKQYWTRLSDEDLTEIEGNYDALLALLQLHYGYTQERAQEEVQALAEQFAQAPVTAPR